MVKHFGKEQSSSTSKALRSGKTSLMISPRHEEARKVAAIVRRQLKAQGAMAKRSARKVLRRLELGRGSPTCTLCARAE